MVFVKPNYGKYREVSDQFKAVLRRYDLKLESCGLDEANLDLTEYLEENQLNHHLGRIYVASRIREEIFKDIRMTASCGIGCNRMLAKICSELNKPNG